MNLLYITIILLGFIFPIIPSIIINKKNKIIKLEYFFYSYILFLIFFVVFAKIFHLILTLNINVLTIFLKGNIIDILKFILSGYSFIGGIIGGIIAILIFSKIIKEESRKLLFIYLPTLILMYSILKIGCFVKGCCGSNYNIPIQLIESIVSFILYVYILIKMKYINSDRIVGISFIGFGIFRFIITLFRINPNNFAFLVTEIICIICIIIGIKFFKKNKHIF